MWTVTLLVNTLSCSWIVNTGLPSKYGSYCEQDNFNICIHRNFYWRLQEYVHFSAHIKITNQANVTQWTFEIFFPYSLTSLSSKLLVNVPRTANRNLTFSSLPGRLATCGASTSQSTVCRGSLHTSWTQTVNPDSPHYARFDRDCG